MIKNWAVRTKTIEYIRKHKQNTVLVAFGGFFGKSSPSTRKTKAKICHWNQNCIELKIFNTEKETIFTTKILLHEKNIHFHASWLISKLQQRLKKLNFNNSKHHQKMQGRTEQKKYHIGQMASGCPRGTQCRVYERGIYYQVNSRKCILKL